MNSNEIWKHPTFYFYSEETVQRLTMKTIVVAGASRGVGEAVAHHLEPTAKRLISVSRTEAQYGDWLKADLSTPKGIAQVANAVGTASLDALLYMGGTWESQAFTADYAFESCSDKDIVRVLNVNLLAPIRLTKALLPALQRSDNPKIVFMGALSGLDNFPAKEVANSASKFGLRGAVHALRENLRSKQIGVTVINPGNIGTPEVLSELGEGAIALGKAIPLTDLLAIIDCILSLSRSTCLKEIDLPAMAARGA